MTMVLTGFLAGVSTAADRRGKRGPFAGGKWFPGLSWMPVLYIVAVAITLLMDYVWAVVRRDVYPVWPMISDTGAQQPESSLFGLGVNLISGLTWGIAFVRSVQLKAYHEDQAVLNKWSYRAGSGAALGLLLVANFQDNEPHVKIVHFVGATFSFACMLAYCWLQALVSKRIAAVSGVADMGIAPSSSRLGKVRMLIASAATFFTVTFLVFLCVSLGQLPTWNQLPAGCLNSTDHGGAGSGGNSTHSRPWEGDWAPCAKGYGLHLVASFSEWLLVCTYVAFFSTFYHEFSKLEISCHPQLSGHEYRPVSATALNDVF